MSKRKLSDVIADHEVLKSRGVDVSDPIEVEKEMDALRNGDESSSSLSGSDFAEQSKSVQETGHTDPLTAGITKGLSDAFDWSSGKSGKKDD